MSIRSSVAVILICGFTSLLLAQAPPAPPKPGPEHKKLEYFVGKWTVESEIKANEFVPAGKTVGTETGTLGPGGFYVESRAEGQLGTRLAIIAYEMLTGAHPFVSANPADFHLAVLAGRFKPLDQHLPDAPARWQELFARAFAREPAHRPNSARAFLVELEHALL